MSVKKLLCCCICNDCAHSETSSSTTSDPQNQRLRSGNSLIDWIRLGNTGIDLTGVGGRVRSIHLTELRKHNRKDDAWLAIRGRVYNVTHYLLYHPGGADELMRGAGRDATELFEKVHPWINYDSLLIKCLIGTLRNDTPDSDVYFDANDTFPESDLLIPPYIAKERIIIRKQLTNYTTPPRKKRPLLLTDDFLESTNSTSLELEELSLPGYLGKIKDIRKEAYVDNVPPALFYDWEQTIGQLTVTIFTGPLSNPGVYSRIAERNLTIEVTINGWVRKIKLVPEEILQEPIKTTVCIYTGKIEITVQKAESKLWKSCGMVNVGTATRKLLCELLQYTIVSNQTLTHDTKFLSMVPDTGSVVFPLGHHVRIHETIAGSEYVRSYTPVEVYWRPGCDPIPQLHLAVKRYDNGIVSPMLTSLNSGDVLKVSSSYGTFQLHKLKSTKTIYLLAAGSGVTPMLNLIKFMLSKTNPSCEQIHILFFNKTEKDIMFRDKLEELTSLESNRCNIVHILSNACTAWTGRKGRISSKLITEILGDNVGGDHVFTCICGPKEFTYSAMIIFKDFGVEESFIHVFIG